ncbi:hypothetical protein DCCM_0211 [Desulfocucumis palustris]|uniref:DUF3006 domain-containing protein n=1 Tax=Desulfocucumis palustris TaxID=1898651 RepID=A0A2L2X7P0_9FIRM|nr:DUF3006 domain-containing protein [Desulfocucumis palustris]GBF32020.1 hypothetical protein DCCM_0211 [Desulfocucumis palustris]
MQIINRFEGQYALIEMNRKIFHVPKSLIPKGAKEGDVIKITITVDTEATANLKKEVHGLADDLFKE